MREQLRKQAIQITSVNEPVEVIDPLRLQVENPGFRKLIENVLDFKAEQDNITRTKRFEMGKMGKAKRGKIPVKRLTATKSTSTLKVATGIRKPS